MCKNVSSMFKATLLDMLKPRLKLRDDYVVEVLERLL
jgi:hypothetical protein